MNKRSIEDIVYILKTVKEHNKPRPVIFLGAGASASAGIPLTGTIITDILEKFKSKPAVKRLSDNEKKDYYKVMSALSAEERRALFYGYITDKKVKINVTHIYLAQLLKEGYVDYILTTNFDDLMLKGCALFNIIPPVYDVSILNDFTTTTFLEKSVTYLHGQHHGQWLLNAEGELNKVKTAVPKIFERICHRRTWIIVGYKGEDEILDEIVKLGSFENDLYWIGYENEEPSEKTKQKLLEKDRMNAYCVPGYNSDSFFLKLNSELGLHTPEIFNKPFSFLKEVINNIKDIDEQKAHDELFKDVNKRLETTKKWIDDAIEKTENSFSEESLKLKISDDLTKENYTNAMSYLETVRKEKFNALNHLLAGLFNNWGNEVSERATKECSEKLFNESLKIFETAHKLDSSLLLVNINWARAIVQLARLKTDEKLYYQAIEKYKIIIEQNSNFSDAHYGLGAAESELAILKKDKELLVKSIENYKKTIALDSNSSEAYYSWGTAIYNLAKQTSDINILPRSFEKFKMAVNINPSFAEAYRNWGNAILLSGVLKKDTNTINAAIDKYKKAIEIDSNLFEPYSSWGAALFELGILENKDDYFIKSIEKFKMAVGLNKYGQHSYCGWGEALLELSRRRKDKSLCNESIDKFKLAIELNSGFFEANLGWGNALFELAKMGDLEIMFNEALSKYKICEKIDNKNFNLYFNWASGITYLAQQKKDRKLFESSFEKYLKAESLKSGDMKLYLNWSTSLLHYLHLIPLEKRETILLQAKSKAQKAYELEAGSYNLACCYSMMEQKKTALKYLEESLDKKQVTKEHVLADRDWNHYIDDDDFNSLLSKY
jgi:tetratricopeptide (TPR) repeat protein